MDDMEMLAPVSVSAPERERRSRANERAFPNQPEILGKINVDVNNTNDGFRLNGWYGHEWHVLTEIPCLTEQENALLSHAAYS